LEEKSNSGKITKKKMFIEITEKMHKEGYTFTWEQVQGRWKTLVTALKKTKDDNNKSGNDRKACFSSFSSASVQLLSNSLRFSWTGNMQEDDDAAGFIEGFSFKQDIKFLFKGTCYQAPCVTATF
jgi:hypothetical protein